MGFLDKPGTRIFSVGKKWICSGQNPSDRRLTMRVWVVEDTVDQKTMKVVDAGKEDTNDL